MTGTDVFQKDRTQMRRIMLVSLVALCGIAGCMTPGATLPGNIENVVVAVREGGRLKDAVIAAASHRRWVPTERDGMTVRCEFVQRAHRVVVDVRLLDDRHYSILMVESNIPARKVSQWVGNLQREIAKHAAR